MKFNWLCWLLGCKYPLAYFYKEPFPYGGGEYRPNLTQPCLRCGGDYFDKVIKKKWEDTDIGIMAVRFRPYIGNHHVADAIYVGTSHLI